MCFFGTHHTKRTCQEGNTPLHYACLSDNPELIHFLLRKAAATASKLTDPSGYENRRQKLAKSRMLEARNSASETPLLRAAVGGDVAVAQALLVNTKQSTIIGDM